MVRHPELDRESIKSPELPGVCHALNPAPEQRGTAPLNSRKVVPAKIVMGRHCMAGPHTTKSWATVETLALGMHDL